jgi:hypothetical protein
VFYIEVLLANIGVWTVMNPDPSSYEPGGYEKSRRLEMLYVKEDIQIATMFQFTAVYTFTRLTSSLLTDTSLMKGHSDEEVRDLAKEYKRLILQGGFLGIWLYVIAGILRAIVVIAICTYMQIIVARDPVDFQYVDWLEDVEVAFTALIGLTFMFLTILSVINMLIMTRTTIISRKLGDKAKGEHDANKKFIGVRLLLICSEVVPKVLELFTEGTPQFEQMKNITSYVRILYMSAEQAEILKNSLLSFACFLAAVANFIFWRSLDIEQAGLLDFSDVSRTNQNNYNQLADNPDGDRTPALDGRSPAPDEQDTISLLS